MLLFLIEVFNSQNILLSGGHPTVEKMRLTGQFTLSNSVKAYLEKNEVSIKK